VDEADALRALGAGEADPDAAVIKEESATE
jgi:hypothetical protein